MDSIDTALARWKTFLRSHELAALHDALDDEVIFYSPVVYTPQVGRELTAMYLLAAGQALPGETAPSTSERRDGSFRYTKEVSQGDTAVLEFETTVAGKYVNGVDIIRCNEDGRIVEFRVMVRPLQAVNAVHQQMAATLERMAAK